jgi:hypothetical protein
LAAFSFHRTAYRERIETVEKALAVIEKVRQYRPKPSASHHQTKSSGGRTPVLGGLGAFSEKQHFKALSGALKEVAPPVSREHSAATTAGSTATMTDEEYAGDVDYRVQGENRTFVRSTEKGKKEIPSPNRLSWSHGYDTTTTDEIERNNIGQSEIPTIFVGDPRTSNAAGGSSSQFMSPSQHEKRGSEPIKIRSGDRERVQLHRYPPTLGSGMSSNGQNSPLSASGTNNHKYDLLDSVPLKAAMMLKHAVLHDARNLSGKTGDLGGLTWHVNSAHEAKVISHLFLNVEKPGRVLFC